MLMIGAKNLVALSSNDDGVLGGLKFQIGRGAKKKINVVEIKLMDNDTYNVRFLYIRGTTIKEISCFFGVYCDQLMDLFEDETGFYLTLKARR